MKDERQIRNKGEIIKLGELFYQISDVEGIGGSTIVYRASYEDSLNKGLLHHVLIKELFPYESKENNIYRDTSGNIICREECVDFFEQCKERFIQGNQANLELLSKNPEYVSGNVNSYEAYGTYYSVLSLHGGENLQTILNSKTFFKLPDAVKIITQILDALESFHKNNLLHLDISPDNIILLPKQAMLIDYNSVSPVQRNTGEIYYYSKKYGYSAPEMTLRLEKKICTATDLYSVCAVFFRLLTGKCVSEKDLTKEKGLVKYFSKTLSSFEGQPLTARLKAVQVVCKGLHLLSHKRYQSIGEMRHDMEDLLLRLEGKGISDSAIWEAGVKRFKIYKLLEGQYLTRQIQQEDKECLSEEQCLKMLASGSSYLLKGSGGMGKTQFLIKLWSMCIHDFQKQIPIVIYIPLCDYQKSEAENNFIKKAVLRQLKFSTETLEDALHELEHVFMQASQNGRRYVFLLDGLNEAGMHREYLLKEIEELSHYEGIGILVTDRTNSVKKYGLDNFEVTELLPLTESAIEQELIRQKLTCPSEEKLKHLLSNPMMLQLYCKTYSMDYVSEHAENRPESVNELIAFYLENLEKQELRKFSGDEKEQLCISYLLNHLLPKCADELKKHKKTLFSLEELYGILKKDYQHLQDKDFGISFPEYMGKTRLMFRDIHSDKEWFDYAVEEQLVGRLNLLERTPEGNYGLIHDNYIDCLAKKEYDHHALLNRYHQKEVIKKAASGIAIFGLFLLMWEVIWKRIIVEDPAGTLNFITDGLSIFLIYLTVKAYKKGAQSAKKLLTLLIVAYLCRVIFLILSEPNAAAAGITMLVLMILPVALISLVSHKLHWKINERKMLKYELLYSGVILYLSLYIDPIVWRYYYFYNWEILFQICLPMICAAVFRKWKKCTSVGYFATCLLFPIIWTNIFYFAADIIGSIYYIAVCVIVYVIELYRRNEKVENGIVQFLVGMGYTIISVLILFWHNPRVREIFYYLGGAAYNIDVDKREDWLGYRLFALKKELYNLDEYISVIILSILIIALVCLLLKKNRTNTERYHAAKLLSVSYLIRLGLGLFMLFGGFMDNFTRMFPFTDFFIVDLVVLVLYIREMKDKYSLI